MLIAVAILLVSTGTASAPAVTVVSTAHPIEAFAHDGAFVAWKNPPCTGGAAPHPLHMRSLITGADTTIGLDPFCEYPLAVAGNRALWQKVDGKFGVGTARMLTAAASSPTQRTRRHLLPELHLRRLHRARDLRRRIDARLLEVPYKEATDGYFRNVTITGGATYRLVNNTES